MRVALQGTVAAVPCKDAVRDYGTSGAVHPTDRGVCQVIHTKHKDWVTQVRLPILTGDHVLPARQQQRNFQALECSLQSLYAAQPAGCAQHD